MQLSRSLARHSRIRFFLTFGLVVMSLAVLSPKALGQVSSASVTGNVRDGSAANVVGAVVVLQNVDTKVVRETVSNGAGRYSFPSVPPGNYTLNFTATGFETQDVQAFQVAVDQTVDVNANLRVGEVHTTMVVEAQGTQVESATAQLGTVIAEKQVNDLPLNGRNFTQLLQLTPGATPISVGQNAAGTQTAITAGSQFTFPSINGQPNRATMFLVDGLNDNDAWYNTYAIAPIVDSIQEFKINSHSDAEYGQVLGGVVNVSTKSGTNSFHGSAWEYVRNNDFDATTYFPSRPLYHQNQFGGSLGGPVVLPHLYDGHDKTFFFIAAEGFHYSKGNGTYFLQPTAAQLGESTWGGAQNLGYGDFSSATTGAAGCSAGATSTATCQLYDPTVSNAASNRPAYVGNQIPVSEMDSRAVAYINAIFSAPIVIPGVSPTTDNGEITDPSRQTQYNYTARIDQHIGTRDFIFFRYSGQTLETVTPGAVPHLFSDNTLPSQQYGLSWLHVFSPSTSMQVQYGRTHVESNILSKFNVADITGTYGMSGAFAGNYIGGVTLLPSLAVTGYFSGGEVESTAPNLSSVHEWKGSVVRTFGAHVVQVGGGWDEINYTQIIRQPSVTFSAATTGNFAGNPGSTVASSIATTQAGNALASFLLDFPSAESKINNQILEQPGGIAEIYVQDSWKATSRLTANFGLRYDRTVIPQLQAGLQSGDFDFHTGEYILQETPQSCSVTGQAPCVPGTGALPDHVRVAAHGKILEGTKLNFAPRLGLAYRVNDHLAVRAGFGITFDNWAATLQLPQNFDGTWPNIGSQGLSNTNTPGSAYVSAQNPFGTSSGNLPAASPFLSSNVAFMVDPEIRNPYSEQWNAGIEQQFGSRVLLALNYVGSESHRLDLGGFYNTGTPAAGISFATRQTAGTTGQPFPYTVPNRWDHSGGNGTYNALQASLARSFASGLAYQVAYTWSKAIDEGDSGWFGAEGFALEDPYNPRGSRSVSAYNVPQLFTVNVNYELPFGKQHSTGNRVVDYIVGNWQVNSIFLARSGQVFSITAAGDIANTGNGATYERANLTGNPKLVNRTRSEWFNTAAFSAPASGTLGNAGRNILQDQTYWDLDSSVIRRFPIHDSLAVELRAEAFNVLNHPVLGTPANSVTTPSSFGQITSTASSQRLMQFAAKIVF
ncbi:Carboxypeptidase regulatory-like domain-containing protein [Bryocella elongata]|uniref:Carboxypeptidase regulatory-like domain-containing protein n=1 Tax=Bryocella elongata TaxID=863522 RepID=A0A1H5VT17_9BACT|nr:carboxypeptidase-like regulatory domain-containing protein [Bryocella elongata]SEF89991.1 Carboxypeptidase regulatory-like domain-containing protein [Bryocella elongata]